MKKTLKFVCSGSDFIVFPEHMEHREFGFMHPKSAGFIRIYDGELICYGGSDSLKLKSIDEENSTMVEYLEKSIK